MTCFSKDKQKDIIKILCAFRQAFPNSKADSDTMLIYACALMDLDVSVLKAAMIKILQTSKFFPSVAEIRSTAEDMVDFYNKTTLPTDGEAWEEVQRQVRKIGPYSSQTWEFSCPEVERAARQFGLMELCRLQENEVNTARAQFMRIYNSYQEKMKMERDMEAVLHNLSPARKVQFLAAAGADSGLPSTSASTAGRAKILPLKIKTIV